MNDVEKIYQNAMNTAIRLLSRRNHTAYEITRKLRQRGFDTDIINRVISECKQFNYINDETTARFYLRELKTKGYGTRRIRFSMKKRGISDVIIDNFLDEYKSEDDELEIAEKAIQKKLTQFRREKNPQKRREKMYRFLYSRGFPGNVISEVIRRHMG